MALVPALIIISSVNEGIEAGLQFAAVDQLPPPAAPTQVLAAPKAYVLLIITRQTMNSSFSVKLFITLFFYTIYK
jgi:hypothetical protein